MKPESLPAVLALNGPPHSGKTYLHKVLRKLIPDAIVLHPIHMAYRIMQDEGEAPKGQLYDDFKLTPDARQRLIAKANMLRSKDSEVFEKYLVNTDEYKAARVVIIDNVGHVPTEHLFYERHSSALVVLRIDTRFNEIEPIKSRSRRLKAVWENDSRSPVEHHTMLTAYDSLQMVLLLEWLSGPLTNEEAGPYYGIKSLWSRYFAASEPTGDLFAPR